MKEKNYKRATIKISKKATFIYDAEKRLLISVKNSQSKKNDYLMFQYNLQVVLPEYKISKKVYIQKIMELLSPSELAQRIIEYKSQHPEITLKQALNETEFHLIQEISGKIIGSDDDPTRVYEFLGNVLKETSKEMDKLSSKFVEELSKELFNKGIEL
ncbi:MAG: hypothetical protein NZ853_10825 [Leptospiraceae bacterium]|nr:hypothetical protein [Leptospiraceae bacterium]MDW7977053.1 hypothetical protein [Leptospiraceae bacterium]